MNRLYAILFALAALTVLGACDSHSWEKETSQLFHKKGHHGEHAEHGASHAPAAHTEHAAPEKKAAH
jgi:hypothetical protein